jgi:hypothetical protein
MWVKQMQFLTTMLYRIHKSNKQRLNACDTAQISLPMSRHVTILQPVSRGNANEYDRKLRD